MPFGRKKSKKINPPTEKSVNGQIGSNFVTISYLQTMSSRVNITHTLGGGDVMEHYIKELRTYVTEHKILFDGESAEPCLDSLWWHYGESHAMMNDETRRLWQELHDCLSGLSFLDCNTVISQVGGLCAEHERIAFVSGLRLGAQLIVELSE